MQSFANLHLSLQMTHPRAGKTQIAIEAYCGHCDSQKDRCPPWLDAPGIGLRNQRNYRCSTCSNSYNPTYEPRTVTLDILHVKIPSYCFLRLIGNVVDEQID